MRLGVCGMLPEFRAIQHEHLEAIRALGLTGAAFHGDGQQLFDVTTAECERVRTVYAAAGMDQPQFAIGFGECLFGGGSGECEGEGASLGGSTRRRGHESATTRA